MAQNCVRKHVVELGALNTCLEPVLEPIIYFTPFFFSLFRPSSQARPIKMSICAQTPGEI